METVGYIRAIYRDGSHIRGRIISVRQQFRGVGYPTRTLYTIKPYNCVMGENKIREQLLVGEEMLTHEIEYQPVPKPSAVNQDRASGKRSQDNQHNGGKNGKLQND